VVQNRMHLQGNEATGWCILLPLLVKIYAKTKLLPEERGTDTLGACGGQKSLSIPYIGKISSSQIRYQRTPSMGRVSEGTLIHYFRKHFFHLLEQKSELYITQIIHGLQEESE